MRRQSRVRTTFFAGLLAIIPLIVTVAVTAWLFDLLTNLIPRVLEQIPSSAVQIMLDNRFAAFGIRVFGLIALILCIYVVGLVARNVVGRRILRFLEGVLLRVPLVRTIYTTVQQIGHALWSSSDTGMFRQVGLVEYPREGVYAIGFVTAQASTEINYRTREDLLSIFVPTTPNPTSGYLLLYRREDVIILDMSVADGMRLVISGGVVNPPFMVPETNTANPKASADD